MRPVSEGNDHRHVDPARHDRAALRARRHCSDAAGWARSGPPPIAVSDEPLRSRCCAPTSPSRRSSEDDSSGKRRAAARINHPNVVAIYDIGEDDGVPFIVMERLPGNSLSRELATGPAQSGPRMRPRSPRSFRRSARAPARCHPPRHQARPTSCSTPSRTPRSPTSASPKLAEEDSHTTMGIVFGTASYLAPERLAGHVADARQRPLRSRRLALRSARRPAPVPRRHAAGARRVDLARRRASRSAELRPDVDPAVVAVVERAMRQDPAARFASASEMAAALAAATETTDAVYVGEPTVATPIVMTPTSTTRVMAPAVARERRGRPRPRRSRPRPRPRPPVRREAREVARRGGGRRGAPGRGDLVDARLQHRCATVFEPADDLGIPTSSIPAPLNQAIDDLDQAVQP